MCRCVYNHFLLLLVPAECDDGDLRLVGGDNEFEGRLEICFDRLWGTVCQDSFGSSDAAVACWDLGYMRSSKEKPV